MHDFSRIPDVKLYDQNGEISRLMIDSRLRNQTGKSKSKQKLSDLEIKAVRRRPYLTASNKLRRPAARNLQDSNKTI